MRNLRSMAQDVVYSAVGLCALVLALSYLGRFDPLEATMVLSHHGLQINTFVFFVFFPGIEIALGILL